MKRLAISVVLILAIFPVVTLAQSPQATTDRDQAAYQRARGLALDQIGRLSNVIPSDDESRRDDWERLYELEQSLNQYSMEIDATYSQGGPTDPLVAQWSDVRNTSELVEIVYTYTEGPDVNLLHRQVGGAIHDFGEGTMEFAAFRDYVAKHAATIPTSLMGLLQDSIRSDVETNAVVFDSDSAALVAIGEDTQQGFGAAETFIRGDAVDDGDALAADVYQAVQALHEAYDNFSLSASAGLPGTWADAVRYYWISDLLFLAHIHAIFNGYEDVLAVTSQWLDGDLDLQGFADALWALK